jgi:hypothetical protein
MDVEKKYLWSRCCWYRRKLSLKIKRNFSCLNTCILIYFVDRLWNTEALNFLSGPHLEKECFLKAVQNILNQITLNIKHCLHLFIFKLNFLRYQQHLLQRYFFSTSIHLLCNGQQSKSEYKCLNRRNLPFWCIEHLYKKSECGC